MKAIRTPAKAKKQWVPESVIELGRLEPFFRKIVFDLHGVILNWQHLYYAFVNEQYGYNIDADKVRFYYLDPKVPATCEQLEEAFDAFVSLSRGGYGDLAIYPGIVEDMHAIRDAGIAIEIWTWTPGVGNTKSAVVAPFETGCAQAVTQELLASLKLPIDPVRDVRFMPLAEKRGEMVEEHIPLIVEDSVVVASMVAESAHAAILMPTEYNKTFRFKNVHRLKHRRQLVPVVLNFYAGLEEAGVLRSSPHGQNV